MSLTPPSPQRILGPDAVLALLLIATLPAVSAPGFSHLLALRLAVLILGGAGVLLLWGIQVARGTEVNVRGAGLLALLGTVALVGGVSAVWAANPWEVITPFGVLLAVVSVALAVLAPTGRPISLRAFVLALSSGLLVGGTLTVMRLFGTSLLTTPKGYPSTEHWLVIDSAALGAIAAPLCLAALLRYGGVTRVMAALGVLMSALLLGLSHTSEVLWAFGIGSSVALGGLLVVRRGAAVLGRATLGMLSVGALVIVVAQISLPSDAPLPRGALQPEKNNVLKDLTKPADAILQQVPAIPRSDGARAFLATTSLSAFADRPINGHGLGQSAGVIERYRDGDSAYFRGSFEPLPPFRSSHSTFLTLLMELGLLGLIPLLGFLVLVVVHGIRAAHRLPQSEPAAEHTLWGAACAASVGAVLLATAPLESLAAAAGVLAMATALLVAVEHELLETGFGLGAWSLPQARTGGLDRARLVAFGVLPLLVVTSISYLEIRVVIGDYHRQWGNLLYIQQEPGQLQKAIEHFETARRHNPGDTAAMGMLATSHADMLHFPEAIASLEEALTTRPSNERLLLARARIARLTQRVEEARVWYTAALDVHPRLIEARIGLAQIVSAQGSTESAIALLREGLHLEPPPESAVEVHLTLARFYLLERRAPEAARQVALAEAIAEQHRLFIHTTGLREDIGRLAAHDKDPLPNGISPGPRHDHGNDLVLQPRDGGPPVVPESPRDAPSAP